MFFFIKKYVIINYMLKKIQVYLKLLIIASFSKNNYTMNNQINYDDSSDMFKRNIDSSNGIDNNYFTYALLWFIAILILL